jgi:sulfatase modifying factor 1
VGQWKRFMAATGAAAPPAPDFDRAYFTNEANAERPVVNVSWNDAKAYADWAGRRLPTEAEWELAARGPEGRLYPWGNDPPTPASEQCNIQGAGDGFGDTSPVGAFPKGATPQGVQDMAGNVWQWTLDFYDAGYYAHSKPEDPEGPQSGTQFTLRGGAFTSSPADVRSTNRYARGPDERARNVGFRTVADFPQ